MNLIDSKKIEELIVSASESPRRRMNCNIHESLDAPCQRLINVLLPDTVVPVHRHPYTDETYVILHGKIFVVFLDDTGAECNRCVLDPKQGNFGINIPAGQWHTVEVVEPSAIFEAKDGPYIPIQPDDIMY